MSSTDSQPSKDQAATLVEDLTGGSTANEPIPDTDTSTTSRGAAADTVAGGDPVRNLSAESYAKAAARYGKQDIEPPRVSNDRKPDITDERAPSSTEATKSAPTVDVDKVKVDKE